MELPAAPKPPLDPDDAADVARYDDELAAYEEAIAAYQQALDELQQMDGWKKWDKVIKGPRAFDPDSARCRQARLLHAGRSRARSTSRR